MSKLFSELSPEVKYELWGIVLVTAGIMGFISLLGVSTGPAGDFIARMLRYGLGVGAFGPPIILMALGSKYVWSRREVSFTLKFWGIMLAFLLGLIFYHQYKIPPGREIMPDSLIPGGGLLAGLALFSLRKLFGFYGSIIVLTALSFCALVMTSTWSLAQTLAKVKEKAQESVDAARQSLTSAHAEQQYQASQGNFFDQERYSDLFKRPVLTVDESKAQTAATVAASNRNSKAAETSCKQQEYVMPPLTLLAKGQKPRHLKLARTLADNAKLLEETLDSFGVSAKIINTCQGPAVTRYEMEPAPGVKVSRIVNLSDDIALKLAAPGVRIEAPIPGKAALGIEVPNKEVASVPLREVLESKEFQTAPSGLTVGLGKDIAGQTIVADLAKMPHLLVAGATGSGKSVCINTLIASILFKVRPAEVKFILIDPKVVELSNYNGIPHLMTPVVTDAKKAASSLRWAVQEMERRYALFADAGVRDIGRFNETKPEEGQLPLIVIVIDELADLMMVAPVDVEDAICRLAQMARAAGIHLVLATQRPSVDVITGTIKANIPSRIAFAVSSQVDSRTILDMAGAEKLLGKGDMLFFPIGAVKPVRVQGAFISDSEVEQLVNFITSQAKPQYTDGITSCDAGEDKRSAETFEDELLEDAVRVVLESGQASVSLLQRKFRIGYTRAARLIDTMHEMKIIGPNTGSKPREIIMTSEQVYSRYFRK